MRVTRRLVPVIPAVLLVALLLVLPGCRTTFIRRGVERRVEKRLADLLGPAEHYRVRIRETRDPELALGRARRVEIDGQRILAKGQFLIDSLRLTLIDLRYEGGAPSFLSVRRSDLDVEFTDTALNSYLKAYHARYEPDFRFEAGVVHAQMTYKFLGSPTPIRAAGRLVVREGRQLLFDADTADVSFVDDPAFAERFVEDRVNPILDLSRIEFPARLDSVEVLQGRIRAHGSAALPREARD